MSTQTADSIIAGIQLYVEGLIFSSNGEPINNATIELQAISSGQRFGNPSKLTTNVYEAWTDQDPAKIGVRFSAPGYSTVVLPFTTLYDNSDVVLQRGTAISPIVIMAVLAAVLIYRKRTGKVGSFTSGDLMPIFLLVGGFIGFDLIKKTLISLGIWNSQDTKDLDNAADDPNSFWNPTYWQHIKPAGKEWTYAITDTTARAWSKELYDSFGPFNDCEECAIAIFKRCRTKANASFLAYNFMQVYGQDLLTFLRGGIWPQDRLSDSDVAIINRFIQSLPNY